MRFYKTVIHYILALTTFIYMPSSFSQKLEGVYIGSFEKKNIGIVELKGSGDLITGVVQTSIGKKWFFYGFTKGSTFENQHLFDLGDSPYVKGEVKKDTLYLSLDTRDSSYAGVFIRAKKKNEIATKKALQLNSGIRDVRLVGEWICIDDTAPEKHRSINWRMTLLENGVSIPDYEAAKRQYLKFAAERGFKPKSYPIIKFNATWQTTNDARLIIMHERFNTGVEEIVSTYKLKNDTLKLTNIKNYTSVFIRTDKK